MARSQEAHSERLGGVCGEGSRKAVSKTGLWQGASSVQGPWPHSIDMSVRVQVKECTGITLTPEHSSELTQLRGGMKVTKNWTQGLNGLSSKFSFSTYQLCDHSHAM